MKRAKRPVLASVLASAMMLTAVAPLPAVAGSSAQDRPGEIAMIADSLIARPVLFASTVVGAGLWLVTSPFSLLGGNIGEAGEVLVLNPGKSTFIRCLGCTPAQHESLKAEKATKEEPEEAVATTE
ncbi:hypothetical protein Y5S_02021 [Alcanivorax nanhaiticus]|uniref:Cation/multidrug efflux pump n=1 Tax=Alcanivorax nanhaiticus TaxID=1177154 RepID=A0A095UQ58_9GAMM|nr:hypothetical protein [Alcanivorax nanhaiticus]KGD64655.1 hypothetical protein Y5S_02021 [Alcanivorax nanhaiticus]